MKSKVWLCGLIFVVLGAAIVQAAVEVPACQLEWTSPSKDDHGSMPLGNGETGINAWVQQDGTLHFYLARTDAWSGNGRLLKLGHVEVRFNPNPFAGSDFEQVLDVNEGEMRVHCGDFNLRLWVDANDDLVRMEASGAVARSMTVSNRPWRTEEREVDCSVSSGEVHSFFNLRKGPENARIRPDIFFDQPDDGLLWCHHNDYSLWKKNMQGQALGALEERQKDPLMHRTFGVLVRGTDLVKQDRMTLQSINPSATHYLTARTYTAFCEQPGQWVDKIVSVQEPPLEKARAAHRKWWQEFNQRSFIDVSAAKNSPASVTRLIKEPAGQFNIGTCQRSKVGFQGAMAWMKIFGEALSPLQIDESKSAPRSEFDFSKPAAKAGVYQDKYDSSRTARNRVQTWPVTVDGHAGVSFDGKSWLAVPQTEGILPPRAVTLDVFIRPEKQRPAGGRILDFSKLYSNPLDGLILDTYPGNSLRMITPGGTLQAKGQLLVPAKWQRVTANYDAAAGKAVLYLDGTPVAEATFAPVQSVEGAASGGGKAVANLSQAYALQRYMNACAGRGQYPIKFNGSLFTVSGNQKNENFEPDYRRWGEPYWFQNTRLPYWSMLASGDVEFMQPFFLMYLKSLDTARYRAKTFYDADGAVFPEIMMFWGTSPLYVYGWPEQRAKEKLPDGLIQHRMHRYHWTAGIELAVMMLDYYRYTGNDTFARKALLPLSNDILAFYRTHYSVGENGRLVFDPSQALESWWNTVNPMPEVAGLRFLLEGLLELPESLADADQKTAWREYLMIMPEVPMREIGGKSVLWVADKTPVKPKNVENPELYAIFPFRLYGVGEADIEVALRAFDARRVKVSSGWSQDDIQAAILGLTDEAASCVLKRANAINPKSRFPVFFGPNYDWVPDQDHGSVLLTALQRMLLQPVGDRLLLFPAWPAKWNVTFRLHAPQSTVITGEVRDGKLISLDVDPASRRNDIEFLGTIDVSSLKGENK